MTVIKGESKKKFNVLPIIFICKTTNTLTKNAKELFNSNWGRIGWWELAGYGGNMNLLSNSPTITLKQNKNGTQKN